MLFCMTADITTQSAKGMMENPTDREEALRKVADACGGKLIAWYGTSGGNTGVLVIVDVPDGIAAQSIAYAGIASGANGNFQVKRLFTAQEMIQVARKATEVQKAYRPPGT